MWKMLEELGTHHYNEQQHTYCPVASAHLQSLSHEQNASVL